MRGGNHKEEVEDYTGAGDLAIRSMECRCVNAPIWHGALKRPSLARIGVLRVRREALQEYALLWY